jgi:hypothetical protein
VSILSHIDGKTGPISIIYAPYTCSTKLLYQ